MIKALKIQTYVKITTDGFEDLMEVPIVYEVSLDTLKELIACHDGEIIVNELLLDHFDAIRARILKKLAD